MKKKDCYIIKHMNRKGENMEVRDKGMETENRKDDKSQ